MYEVILTWFWSRISGLKWKLSLCHYIYLGIRCPSNSLQDSTLIFLLKITFDLRQRIDKKFNMWASSKTPKYFSNISKSRKIFTCSTIVWRTCSSRFSYTIAMIPCVHERFVEYSRFYHIWMCLPSLGSAFKYNISQHLSIRFYSDSLYSGLSIGIRYEKLCGIESWYLIFVRKWKEKQKKK